MSEICMIAPTIDAKALGDAGTAVCDARAYAAVTIAASSGGEGVQPLTGAEEVDIYKSVGGEFVPALDLSGNAYKLTATVRMVELAGGNIYAVAKDATNEPCGVFAGLRTV